MRVKLQLVMCNDQGEAETVTDVITLNKNHQYIEHLGLTLAESKHLLSTLQRHLEQPGFIEGDASDWALLPLPGGSFKVGIDGGYVRNWMDKKRNFEVIVGKSTLSFGEGEEEKTPWHKRFGFVQTYDDAKPKRRLHEGLHTQGLQMNQEMTFLSDGNDTLRALQLEMSPKTTHILDWFHLAMQLTVLSQYGKGLVQCEAEWGEQICDQIERLKWLLWHGQVDKALGKINDLQTSVEPFHQTYA